jgi:hypothetical protein
VPLQFSTNVTVPLKVPPAVVERLGVELAELENLHVVLTSINAAALAAGALDSELDR